MSGLDKFFKAPPKPQKKATAKVIENPISQKPSSKKRGIKPPLESDENVGSPVAQTLPTPVQPEQLKETDNILQESILENEISRPDQDSPTLPAKFVRYQLKCPDKKCNYQRILVKSTLSPRDLTCPKCGNEMFQKVIKG